MPDLSKRGLLAGAGAAALARVARAQGDGAEGSVTGRWVHAWSPYGRPLHGPDFSHFDYVDPAAPKGGTMYSCNPDRRSSFDKFNYFSVKGNAPCGLLHYMHESLAVRGADEPQTMYGLLAEAMWVAPDLSSVAFRLHPQARFSNGDPVLAADVKHSWECLAGPMALPEWNALVGGAAAAVVEDERTIRFPLKERSGDTVFNLGTYLQVFSRKWGGGKPFDQIVDEPPIASGPYTIASHRGGRRIEFRRNPGYWARDLPARRGFFNFDRVVFRYYQDEDIQVEAFKAGEFDILRAYRARVFARQHRGRRWDSGDIVKAELPTETVEALQSYVLNLRRPLFQDIRVRQALGLTWNFESSNRYGGFKQADSLFNNSRFAAEGLPSAAELALLEPFRAQLPPEVFGPPYRAPRTGDDPNGLRRNLLKARALMAAAGWTAGPDGVMRNARGEPFVFEYLAASESTIREVEWARILRRLGIELRIRPVDYALFYRRAEEFDFDTMTIVDGHYTLPSVASYQRILGSKMADVKASDNLRGVKSAAVDRILEAMAAAQTLAQLQDACRALDRVVMWNHWQVPQLYKASIDLSYWNKFGRPAKAPRYYTVSVTIDVEPQLAWPELTWWAKGT
ncbi:MAG: extracellular solute-binding protein [Rubrivivax sp.]